MKSLKCNLTAHQTPESPRNCDISPRLNLSLDIELRLLERNFVVPHAWFDEREILQKSVIQVCGQKGTTTRIKTRSCSCKTMLFMRSSLHSSGIFYSERGFNSRGRGHGRSTFLFSETIVPSVQAVPTMPCNAFPALRKSVISDRGSWLALPYLLSWKSCRDMTKALP